MTNDHNGNAAIDYAAISYSDGEEVESYLLSVLSQAKDLSTKSQELKEAIRDWPTEYHLSQVRHNLFLPIDFQNVQSILEIGAGCGAITRFFGEMGSRVLAVEGAAPRAEVCKARCSDLSNVTVTASSLENLKLDNTFDLVTLVGVLEYFSAFSKSADPVQENLTKIFNALSDNGTLLIAIENKLGLKYLAGFPEDHLNEPYVGVEDRYPAHGPRTYGRKELETLLTNVGFQEVEMLYPFPDYKLPSVIVTNAGANESNFAPADLLSRLESRSDGDNFTLPPSFDDNAAWKAVSRNGLLPDLSNSFLILAHKGVGSAKPKADLLAISVPHHARGRFATSTSFIKKADQVVVVKNVEELTQDEANSSFALQGGESPYLSGSLYFDELKDILRSGKGVAEIVTWAEPWVKFLKDAEVDSTLPKDFVDCLPYNLIRKTDGSIAYFDREWQSKDPIPFAWIFVRGLAFSLAQCSLKGALNGRRYGEVVRDIAARLNLSVGDVEIKKALEMEKKLNQYIFGKDASEARADNLYLAKLLKELITDTLVLVSSRVSRLEHEVERLQRSLSEAEDVAEKTEADIRLITKSKSWKVTAPLRGLKGLLR